VIDEGEMSEIPLDRAITALGEHLDELRRCQELSPEQQTLPQKAVEGFSAVLQDLRAAAEALHSWARHDVRQLPAWKNGQLAGLLRRRDITRWLQLHWQSMENC
jgi:hypothetical protein